MYFPTLKSQVESTVKGGDFRDRSAVQVVASPYRICPIGAHVDHQGGEVLGVAINAYTVLAFVPSDDGSIHLTSDDFPGIIEFSTNRTLGSESDWGRYARGALFALQKQYPQKIKKGWAGHISGRVLGAGLSSSASAGIAYLMAFAKVNDLDLSKAELVELDRIIENEYLGLNNGIQDQTTIVFGRKDGIVHQDTRNRIVTSVPHAADYSDYAWLVIYSGFSRELTSSSFNDRVAECWQAAQLMMPDAQILGDVGSNQFAKMRDQLPADLQRRATHFFTETDRVEQGRRAWETGDFKQFGNLMNASCHSSIYQYECGSEPLIRLHEIALGTVGVLGNRFSGGGFGGCLVALARKDLAGNALKSILDQYRLSYPEKAEVATGWIASGIEGAAYYAL